MFCSSIDSHARVRIIVAYVNLVFLAQLVYTVITNVDLVDSSSTRHQFLFWIQTTLLLVLLVLGFVISFCADGFRVCLFIYSLLIGMLLFTQMILYVPTTIASNEQLINYGLTSKHAANYNHSYLSLLTADAAAATAPRNNETIDCDNFKTWSNRLECCDLKNAELRKQCCPAAFSSASITQESHHPLSCATKYYMYLVKFEILGFIIFTVLDIMVLFAVLKLLWTNIYFAPDPNKRQRVLSVSGY